MCGIAGIIGPDRERTARALSAMLRCQTHRGPDDEGTHLIQVGPLTVALGQRRLAIIDLSPAGHQPMVNPATGDALTFNGEIYNYQSLRKPLADAGQTFRGHSDTEVLLYGIGREGPGYVSRACGMYALAFYDARRRVLSLARGPMGIKPLYTARIGDYFFFASEVRAILASGLVPARIDIRGLASVMAYGCVHEPLTFFEGIRGFEPGCYQELEIDGAAGVVREGPVKRHWRFPGVDTSITEHDAVERLRGALDLSVKEHLIADVPVGVFLSSGIDSTIVANLAKRHTDHLRTFTVGFSDQPDLTESALAQETARMLGVDHTDVQVTGPEAQAWFSDWLASLDQPSADGLNTYIISKAVRQRGIVVALSGLGGDELFCGYVTFGELPRIKAGYDLISMMPAPIRRAVFLTRSLAKPASVREKIGDMGASDGDLLTLYLYRRRFQSDQRLHAHGLHADRLDLHPTFMPREALGDLPEVGGDPVAAISRFESLFYMRNMLLRDSDTNAMAHSLEIRVPFVDPRVMSLAYATPGSVRMPSSEPNKHLLRTAFDDLLHTKLKAQSKRGFVLPTRRWMSGPLRGLCEEALASTRSISALNPSQVDSVWREFMANPDHQVWSSALLLVVLGSYIRQAERWAQPATGGGPAKLVISHQNSPVEAPV